MAFRIQSLLCVHILILNAYLPIMTYMSLFTTEQTPRWTVVYYHSHTFCQLKTDNFFTLRIFSTWTQHTVEHAQPHFGSCCRAKQYSEYRRWICTVTLKELLGLVNNSISKWCQHEDLSFGRFEVHFRTKFLVGRYWRHSLKQHRIILPTHVSAQDTSVTRSHGSHHNTCWSWKLPKW